MPPKPLICRRGDRVVGVRGQARIETRRHARVALERPAPPPAVGVVPGHAQRPASSCRGRGRTPAAGSRTPPSSRRPCASARPGRRPESTPPVTSLWPLRYLVTLCIDRSTPMASDRLVDRAGKRVVDHRDHARGAARGGDRADVQAAQRRVDRRLEPHELRRRADDRRRRPELVERDEAGARCRTSRPDRAAGGRCRRRWPRSTPPRRRPAAGRAASSRWPPCRTRTPARPRRRRRRPASAPPRRTVGFS